MCKVTKAVKYSGVKVTWNGLNTSNLYLSTVLKYTHLVTFHHWKICICVIATLNKLITLCVILELSQNKPQCLCVFIVCTTLYNTNCCTGSVHCAALYTDYHKFYNMQHMRCLRIKLPAARWHMDTLWELNTRLKHYSPSLRWKLLSWSISQKRFLASRFASMLFGLLHMSVTARPRRINETGGVREWQTHMSHYRTF